MATTHGLRHKQKIGKYTADTKTDQEFVYLVVDGKPVFRQEKNSCERKFAPAGTNPDYTGFLVYRLYKIQENGNWHIIDSCATKGEIRRIAMKEDA